MSDAFQSRASISGRTRIAVILADPVGHVRTPQGMNVYFSAMGRDAVIVPCHVAAEDLEEAIMGLRRMRNLDGIIVTVPHKKAVATLCDSLTEEARLVGAVNAIRRHPDGHLTGGQFDGEGFVAGLRKAGHSVAGRRVLMAGAGGAASGIGFALLRHGVAALTIYNRTADRAEALAQRLRDTYPSASIYVAGPDPSGHDIVVNATSLGLRQDDPLPIDIQRLVPPTVAVEVVMQPEVTPFLTAAAQRGCATHGGYPMLAEQVALLARFIAGEAD
ncbi:shikimate dehydrogenase family protein [Plastoroseomonas hellenica]|uniref:shikimate dehydrogenase family protein n=1 Tax=Plastoroseomonas hellenica TaxID=2687306 RepID=UPI0034620B7E